MEANGSPEVLLGFELHAGAQGQLVCMSRLWARCQRLFPSCGIYRPHPAVIVLRERRGTVTCALAQFCLGQAQQFELHRGLRSGEANTLLLVGPVDSCAPQAMVDLGISGVLRDDITDAELILVVEHAFEHTQLKGGHTNRGASLSRYEYEFTELFEIARALTTERDINRLLDLILQKSRLVAGADAGSLYVVEGADNEVQDRRLHFKLSQNDSVKFDSSEFAMPVDRHSMAGWVALESRTVRIDDVYQPQPNATFRFDRSFDERTGYRTKSMICTPLVTSRGAVIGVLQLINKKRHPQLALATPQDFEQEVVPFDAQSERLLTAVAAQAGIALENALLYDEIRGLFDGFVRASVDAIESRDPTTSGHSRRVATLTVSLARAVERGSTGAYSGLHFKDEDYRELEYASLLHDFGKIGVRESVLVKSKKLYDHELERIRTRFDFIAKAIEAQILTHKCSALETGAGRQVQLQLERQLAEKLALIDSAWAFILNANEPTVMASGEFSRLQALGELTYTAMDGRSMPWLLPAEIASLSIKRGSLTNSEFDEIRGHVTHTIRFLSRIPWGRSFARVPLIAGAHHERLDGTGYPNRLMTEQIPVQSKMMSIADIFDALTASDRPYKRAVPVDRALDILGLEVKDGHLDPELVEIFAASRAWADL